MQWCELRGLISVVLEDALSKLGMNVHSVHHNIVKMSGETVCMRHLHETLERRCRLAVKGHILLLEVGQGSVEDKRSSQRPDGCIMLETALNKHGMDTPCSHCRLR